MMLHSPFIQIAKMDACEFELKCHCSPSDYMEKMTSKCLITCPRTIDCIAVEVRGQVMRHEDRIISIRGDT